MASLALSHASLHHRFLPLWWRRIGVRTLAPASDAALERTRAERDSCLEAIERNPDAFASELDIQTMMLCMPERL